MPEPSPAIGLAVKRVVVRESRLSIDPRQVSDAEPLQGGLLHVTSMGLLGMLVRLEDELDVVLPDDIFAGRRLHTVADLIELVASGCERAQP